MALTKVTYSMIENAPIDVENYGAKGDGTTDDTAAFNAAVIAAASSNASIQLSGGTYIVTTLSLTNDATFVGSGTIKKKAGTIGHLITTTANLKMSGNITLDQNAANCPNLSATDTSDCTINHSGNVIVLDGVTCLESISSNLNLSTQSQVLLKDCNVTKGRIGVRAVTSASCNVEIIRGTYSSSSKYDNIQVLNSTNVLIDGITSYDSQRSGIVISNVSGICRIVNNNCHGNKIDGAGQGGWGIVASISCYEFVISNNNCWNNQQGGITLDTATATPPYYTNAYFTVSGNIIDGSGSLSTGGYSPNGITVNKAQYGVISGNYIKSVKQSIRLDTTANLSITGNTTQDCNDGYFLQTLNCSDIIASGNLFTTCIAGSGSAGAVNFVSSDKITFTGNHITDITSGRNLIRITNATKCSITNNIIHKTDAGSGQCILFSGTCTNTYIANNKLMCDLAGFQYFIVGTGATLTGSTTCNNEIILSGKTNDNYIYGASTIIGDQDTVNGVKNYFTVAPTILTPRTGATAGIAGALKMWNGSAWV